ncbi:GNAT family N-acetyltransferase [Paenibacillus sp. GCM10027627]|uniref:GNAT family N-acetyltransferase n=1 Tax=unclassified Paenibacillus TaxID=185978 RepID=UPI003643E261
MSGEITTIIRPFRLGEERYVIESHYDFYRREHQYDLSFKRFVEEGVRQFVLSFEPGNDQLWVIEKGERLKGSIAIQRIAAAEARLRWFLIDPELAGQGYGKRLLELATLFCRDSGCETIVLETGSKLVRARELYSKSGFVLLESKEQILSNQLLVTEHWRKDLKLG